MWKEGRESLWMQRFYLWQEILVLSSYSQAKLLGLVNLQSCLVCMVILSKSSIVWCNNADMIKHTADLLKQLPFFISVEINSQQTQDWRNIKLLEHAWEEDIFGRVFWNEKQQIKVGNQSKPLCQSLQDFILFFPSLGLWWVLFRERLINSLLFFSIYLMFHQDNLTSCTQTLIFQTFKLFGVLHQDILVCYDLSKKVGKDSSKVIFIIANTVNSE